MYEFTYCCGFASEYSCNRQSCEASVEQLRRLADGADPKPFSLTYIGEHTASDNGLQEVEVLALKSCVERERFCFIKWGLLGGASAICPKVCSYKIIGSGMFGYVFLAREVDCEMKLIVFQRTVDILRFLRQAASTERLYALKIIPMLRDDWLGTWGPRLRLLPMLQHANVLRYFPSEWHQRGGMNQKSLSYSAAFLIMEWCEMGRLPESVHTLVAFVARIVDFLSLQRQGYSPERSH